LHARGGYVGSQKPKIRSEKRVAAKLAGDHPTPGSLGCKMAI